MNTFAATWWRSPSGQADFLVLVKCDLQTVHTSSLGKREKVGNNQPRAGNEGQQKEIAWGVWWVLMRAKLGSQVQLISTPPDPARMHILREPGVEKALQTRGTGLRATHQCFKNAKCWVDFEAHPEVLRMSGWVQTPLGQPLHTARQSLARGSNLKNVGWQPPPSAGITVW